MFIFNNGRVHKVKGVEHKYVDTTNDDEFNAWCNSDHMNRVEDAMTEQLMFFDLGRDEWYPFANKGDLLEAIRAMIRDASDDVQDMIYKFIEWEIPDE